MDAIPYVEGQSPPSDRHILAQQRDDDGNDLGLIWVDIANVKQGRILHEDIDDLLPMIRWQWRHLKRYATWCRSFEDWELGFMRDENPGSEVAVWLRITYAFLEFVHRTPHADKAAVFTALRSLSVGVETNIRPKSVVSKLKKLCANPPAAISNIENFTEDGRLKAGDKHLR